MVEKTDQWRPASRNRRDEPHGVVLTANDDNDGYPKAALVGFKLLEDATSVFVEDLKGVAYDFGPCSAENQYAVTCARITSISGPEQAYIGFMDNDDGAT